MLRKSLENTVVQVVGKAIMVIISLITTGVLTRKLGVSGYGGFVLISSMFVFLDSLADFGTKTIGVREVSRDPKKEIWGDIFNLRILMTTIAFVLGLLLIWGWAGFTEFKIEATVALMMIYLTSLAGFLEIIFQSKLRMELKVLMDISFPLTFLVGLWLWNSKVSLLWVMSAYLVARLTSLIIGWWLVEGIVKIKFNFFNKKNSMDLWSKSWPMGLFLITFATYDRAVDSLLIQHFLGPVQVAWYGLSYKIYGVMLQPAYYFVNSIFPILSSQKNNSGLLKKSLLIMLIMVFGAMIIVWYLAPWMIAVLGGEEFLPSVGILRTLMWAMFFSYIGHLVGFALIAAGGQKEMLKLGMVALLVNLVLNSYLIPRYGVLAAAWVTVFTEMIDCGMMIWFWKKRKIEL